MKSFKIFIWKVLKKMEIWNIYFNLLHLKYSKYKLEKEIFFLILLKHNSTQTQQLQHWYSKCNSKKKCLSVHNGWAN